MRALWTDLGHWIGTQLCCGGQPWFKFGNVFCKRRGSLVRGTPRTRGRSYRSGYSSFSMCCGESPHQLPAPLLQRTVGHGTSAKGPHRWQVPPCCGEGNSGLGATKAPLVHRGLWGFSWLCYTLAYWYSLIASGISEPYRDFCKWSRLNDVCPGLNRPRQTTDKGPTSLTSIHSCAVITIQGLPQPLAYNFSEVRNAH